MRNCPDVARLSSLFNLRLLYFCLFVILSFYLFVFLSFYLFVFLSFCLFVFSSWQHSDQMSEGFQVSKVSLCVKILKWQSLTHWVSESLTKVRYRAARAAKNIFYSQLDHKRRGSSNHTDRKHLLKKRVIFPLEYDSLIVKTNFS